MNRLLLIAAALIICINPVIANGHGSVVPSDTTTQLGNLLAHVDGPLITGIPAVAETAVMEGCECGCASASCDCSDTTSSDGCECVADFECECEDCEWGCECGCECDCETDCDCGWAPPADYCSCLSDFECECDGCEWGCECGCECECEHDCDCAWAPPAGYCNCVSDFDCECDDCEWGCECGCECDCDSDCSCDYRDPSLREGYCGCVSDFDCECESCEWGCECGCECDCETDCDCAWAPPAGLISNSDDSDDWDSDFEPIEDDYDYSDWSDFSGYDFYDSYRPRFGRTSAHWSGFGLHYSGMVGGLDKLRLPDAYTDLDQSVKSIGVTLNLIDVAFPIARRFAIFSGLGFEFNNFRFSNDVGLTQENGRTVVDYRYIDEGIRLRKSKLNTGYINIPLMLEVQFGRYNDFFINAGVIGGLRIVGKTKVKAKDPQLKGTFKEWSNVSLRNFHYGYSVNIGYKNYAVSATYYPQSIFKNTVGPAVEQVNIGISIMR